MKLFVLGAGVALANKPSWLKKEWEVQDAYFAGEEIILSDPAIRKDFQIFTFLRKNHHKVLLVLDQFY